MRRFTYYISLSVLLLVPAALFIELGFGALRFTGYIAKAIASAKDLVSQDIAFLGELTPAVAATFVAALSPRPLSRADSFASFMICGLGYIAYLLVSAHLDGSDIFFDRSLKGSVEVALEGYVSSEDFDSAFGLVGETMKSVRVFYLVLFAGIIGFSINTQGRSRDD